MQWEDTNGCLLPKAREGQQDLPILVRGRPSLALRACDRKVSEKPKPKALQWSIESFLPAHHSAPWEVTGSVLLPAWSNKTTSLSAPFWSHLPKQHKCKEWQSFWTQGDIGKSWLATCHLATHLLRGFFANKLKELCFMDIQFRREFLQAWYIVIQWPYSGFIYSSDFICTTTPPPKKNTNFPPSPCAFLLPVLN